MLVGCLAGDLCSRLLLWVVGVFWVVWLIMVDCLF